ncbi:MAG: hypothetical protein ACSHYA_13050 [Opitutaceae bacterium]
MITALSFLAAGNLFYYLEDVVSGNLLKCLIALWILAGMVGVDIIKNSVRQKMRNHTGVASVD